MRRCFILVGLIVALVWLVRLGASAAGRAAPPTPVGPVVVPPPAPVVQPVAPPSDRIPPVKGYGETKDAAKERALENARQAVEQYLHDPSKYPKLHWTPDADYLKDIGVVRIIDDETRPSAADPRLYEAVAHVDVSDPNLRKMQEKVDEARKKELEPTVTQRHWLVGRILGSFVALFLVVFGYIKLEELTRGYYTSLLRLGAGAVVVLAVLGLFLAF